MSTAETSRKQPDQDVKAVVIRLGERLRKERKARELTQADLAALLGISIPSYQALEAGRGTTALWTWVAACVLLGIEI
jgi:transcriptional regulator with XRE-family HTH domain